MNGLVLSNRLNLKEDNTMGASVPQIMMCNDLKNAINEVKVKARMYVILGTKWRDFRKPLGAMNVPGLPPESKIGLIVHGVNKVAGILGHTFGIKGSKGRALMENANHRNYAKHVQESIVKQIREIDKLKEPDRSINLSYLQHLADATLVAGRACKDLCQGKSPQKEITRLAVAWVVVLGCGIVGSPIGRNFSPARLDERVKKLSIISFPLFSAGKKLEDIVDPAEAVHLAFTALDVI